MKTARWIYWMALAACLLPFSAPSSWAEAVNPAELPWEKFGATAGYFVSAIDSGARFGTGVGVDIDMEDLLGLESTSSVFRLGALWRFTDNRRHRVDLSWFSLNRDSSRRIGQDITIEDKDGNKTVISAGTVVNATYDLDIYELAYSYSFIQDERLDLAVKAGLFIMPIDVGVSASGLVVAGGTAKFTAPLPALGLRMDIAVTPQWFIRTGAQAFYLEYENFSGSLLEVQAALEYKPWEHVGIGLGFDTMRVNVKAEGEDWPGVALNGKVNFAYAGLQLYLRYSY